MRQARDTLQHQLNREAFIEMWEQYRSLYSPNAIERMEHRVLDALAAAHGPFRELERPPSVDHMGHSRTGASFQQRMADMYPIGGGDVSLRCLHCKDWVNRCFACIECGECVCISCARRERHTHGDARDGPTLAAIGEALGGLTRETARKIQEKALWRLRKHIHGRRDEFVDWL
jgi:hypothetical protein